MKTNNCLKIDTVEFPVFEGININMMPFVIGDKNSIPEEYQHYWPLVEKCQVPNEELNKIGYLSITETIVDKNTSQRRKGIHTEKHPEGNWGGGWGKYSGLFMASNIDNTCRAWDTHIETPGIMGDCEHMRESLGEGIFMKKGELYWMTDSCPHESLPLKETSNRQWFRFVTSGVDLWYKLHSTHNRLGIVAPCKIVETSKF